MVYVLIAATIIFTVTGQLLVKAGMIQVGPFPGQIPELFNFGIRSLAKFKVISGLVLAFLAALTWMGALSLSDISFAYPFMTLAILIALALSGFLFDESVPITRG
jgi:drug/metabolite transporter (DMT)-like permease